jgi:hypothetical protein
MQLWHEELLSFGVYGTFFGLLSSRRFGFLSLALAYLLGHTRGALKSGIG